MDHTRSPKLLVPMPELCGAYIREVEMRLSFGIETSIGDMRKSVIYQTGVDAQLAAYCKTCIQEMKRKKKRVES